MTDFGSHISPLPHRQTQRRANGRSRQRTGRIRCHRLHLPLGHLQYAYSLFPEPAPLSFLQFAPGSETTEQRSAADALGFRPKNVTQEMVRLVFYFSDRMRKPRLLTTAPPEEDPLIQNAYFFIFCFQTDTVSNMFPDIPA